MKRILALIVAAVLVALLAAGPAAQADAAPDRPAHNIEQVIDIANVIDVGVWGPNPNGWTKYWYKSVHFYGLHLVEMCFFDGHGNFARLIYDIGYGTLTLLPHNYECPA